MVTKVPTVGGEQGESGVAWWELQLWILGIVFYPGKLGKARLFFSFLFSFFAQFSF